MASWLDPSKIIVGVDGSEASVEALRHGQRIALALNAPLEAWGCWEMPLGYEGYLAMGIDGFAHDAEERLDKAVVEAFGTEKPRNVSSRLVQRSPRAGLVEGSKHASLLVVGRRGHGGFGGLLLGSVSSACVAHAHCPVLVVHSPGKSH
ncbi:universal stress protein [Paenarthrobacter aurescens]|uniref:universal stress protein n=1 Tax=Paenarthrobacter aurescens TaxID=43663 RepID=UPI0021BFD86D|nr:universal stress protein [Paenarthrobacter aurescens]MCT9868228.1 universal stress protein [Paenarthrobacter aurescens]